MSSIIKFEVRIECQRCGAMQVMTLGNHETFEPEVWMEAHAEGCV